MEREQRNDKAIAIIAEAITHTADMIQAMERQAAADKAEQEALALKMAKADKTRKELLQNIATLQQNLHNETRCRDADEELSEDDVKETMIVEAPLTNTSTYYALKTTQSKQTSPSWPTPKETNKEAGAAGDPTHLTSTDGANLSFCKSYAEALKSKKDIKAARQQYKTPSLRMREPQHDVDDLIVICVKDMEHENGKSSGRTCAKSWGQISTASMSGTCSKTR